MNAGYNMIYTGVPIVWPTLNDRKGGTKIETHNTIQHHHKLRLPKWLNPSKNNSQKLLYQTALVFMTDVPNKLATELFLPHLIAPFLHENGWECNRLWSIAFDSTGRSVNKIVVKKIMFSCECFLRLYNFSFMNKHRSFTLMTAFWLYPLYTTRFSLAIEHKAVSPI